MGKIERNRAFEHSTQEQAAEFGRLNIELQRWDDAIDGRIDREQMHEKVRNDMLLLLDKLTQSNDR